MTMSGFSFAISSMFGCVSVPGVGSSLIAGQMSAM